jgi:hypothetical protein
MKKKGLYSAIKIEQNEQVNSSMNSSVRVEYSWFRWCALIFFQSNSNQRTSKNKHQTSQHVKLLEHLGAILHILTLSWGLSELLPRHKFLFAISSPANLCFLDDVLLPEHLWHKHRQHRLKGPQFLSAPSMRTNLRRHTPGLAYIATQW